MVLYEDYLILKKPDFFKVDNSEIKTLKYAETSFLTFQKARCLSIVPHIK